MSRVGLWTALLVAAGLIVISTTHGDYGVTWDEPAQAFYGERVGIGWSASS